MFGRKRKRDEENVGIAGLGTGDASEAFAPPTTVSVTARPVPTPAPAAGPAPAAAAGPAPIPGSAAGPGPAPMPADTAPASGPGTPAMPSPALEPGMMPTNPAAMIGQILSGQGPIGELVAEIRADPEAYRQRMLAQVQVSGIPNTIQWSATGSGAVQPRQVDVIDELTKAADLHHQGALTDDEFAAIKKKLLGE